MMSLVLQTAPDQLANTGSATSWPALVVLVVVGALAVQRYTDVDLRAWLPTGGTSQQAGQTPDGRLGGLLDFATSTNGILLAGVLLLGAMVLGGVLGLPPGTGVQLVVALELLALYLVLRELDAYSFPLFVTVAAITTMLALSALGEPIIGGVLNSEVGVILVLGLLGLGWRWLSQRGDDQQRIIVRADDGSGGDQ